MRNCNGYSYGPYAFTGAMQPVQKVTLLLTCSEDYIAAHTAATPTFTLGADRTQGLKLVRKR